MRTVKLMTLFWKSVARTKLILFQPFDAKKWLKLLLIASLAGAMGMGSGFNGNQDDDEDSLYEQALHLPAATVHAQDWPVTEQTRERSLWSALRLEIADLGWPPWAVAVFAVIILALGVVMLWLAARFKFIWYEAIVYNTSGIVEPFRKYRPHGNSLFKLFVAVTAISVIFLVFAATRFYATASAAGLFEENARLTWEILWGHFGLLLFVSAVFTVAVFTFHFFVDQLVVPIMAMDNVSFQLAWSKFFNVFKSNVKDMFIFLAVTVLWLMVGSFLAMLVMMITVFIIMLAAGLLFILAYHLLVKWLGLQLIFNVIAVAIGLPFFVAVILYMLSISLPVAVFLRCFTLYYLSSLNCGYNALDLGTAPPETSEDV